MLVTSDNNISAKLYKKHHIMTEYQHVMQKHTMTI